MLMTFCVCDNNSSLLNDVKLVVRGKCIESELIFEQNSETDSEFFFSRLSENLLKIFLC